MCLRGRMGGGETEQHCTAASWSALLTEYYLGDGSQGELGGQGM